MSDADDAAAQAATLSTILEEDFVAPLTAVRGALEILRDAQDLDADARRRFVEQALRGCAEMERGVSQLSAVVYGAGTLAAPADEANRAFAARIRFLEEAGVLDLDLSDMTFEDSDAVNGFYDAVDRRVAATARKWHVIANFRDCRVWPEAWIAFAHRGKKAAHAYAIATVRYAAPAADAPPDAAASEAHNPLHYPSREDALAHVARLQGQR